MGAFASFCAPPSLRPRTHPQAELADRDFTADRERVIVISTGAVEQVDLERAAAERAAAEARHRHRLRLPRRPEWGAVTTPDQLEESERATFLTWRRELAALEQDERLVLTPFEKNLEVWRQLWRVLERSDVLVQVRGGEGRGRGWAWGGNEEEGGGVLHFHPPSATRPPMPPPPPPTHAHTGRWPTRATR